MNIAQARNLDLAGFIGRLGHAEVPKGRDYEAWFLSPLRSEKTPSFKVDRRTQKWKDFGGHHPQGDIVDFVQAYGEVAGWGRLSTSEALARIATVSGHIERVKTTYRSRRGDKVAPTKLKQERFVIDEIRSIQAPKLIDYLRSRKLQVSTAKAYLQQLHYTDTSSGRKYYGLTWENEEGGREVRNPVFKMAMGSKAPSVIATQHPAVRTDAIGVFEGMTDYLSYLQLTKAPVAQAVIMNSTATHQRTVEIVRELRTQATQLLGYLQNDRAGLHVTKKLREALPDLQLENQRYLRYGDLNDYLTSTPLNRKEHGTAQDFFRVHFAGRHPERSGNKQGKKL